MWIPTRSTVVDMHILLSFTEKKAEKEESEESDDDMGFGLFD